MPLCAPGIALHQVTFFFFFFKIVLFINAGNKPLGNRFLKFDPTLNKSC